MTQQSNPILDAPQLATFVAVIRAGSFTAAADALGTDKARISRTIARLEARLGAQLIVRSTRRLSVTEIGREVYERAIGILGALEETEAVVAAAGGKPSGVLRITCGEEFGLLVVSHWIIGFQKAWPQVRVDAVLTNRVVDLIHEGFDLAIRVGSLPDSSLAARKLGDITYGLYASPDYLTRRGLPRNPDDIADHEWIAFSGGSGPLRQISNGREQVNLSRRPRLAVNNSAMARMATQAGLGIAMLPRFQAEPQVKAGLLVQVLPGWGRPDVPVHALFPSSRFLTPKVRAFVDHAVGAFRQTLDG
jgi:LysR family transcriptional regulator, regulator for bpeEF and oprC